MADPKKTTYLGPSGHVTSILAVRVIIVLIEFMRLLHENELRWKFFLDYLDKWLLVSIEQFCPNSHFDSNRMSQLDCQDLCQQNFGCVGISYSHTDRGCYTCSDYTLITATNGYGFYENPGGKQEALYYPKCNNLFI